MLHPACECPTNRVNNVAISGSRDGSVPFYQRMPIVVSYLTTIWKMTQSPSLKWPSLTQGTGTQTYFLLNIYRVYIGFSEFEQLWLCIIVTNVKTLQKKLEKC
jgi:hypothetical protein